MASIRAREGKKGLSYQIRASIGTDKNGRTIYKTTTWKAPAGMTRKKADKEAQRQADVFEEMLRKGLNTDKITFAEVAEQYIRFIGDTQKPTTVKSHQDRLRLINQHIGLIEIKRLTKQHIRDYIAELEQPYTTKNGKVKTRSAVTISDYIKTISAVLSFACESDYIENNICIGKGIRKPQQTADTDKAIPLDVIQQYVTALESAPLHDRLFFHLTLNAGMRKGEVLGLDWSNIDLDNNTICIVDNSQYIPGQGIIFQTTKRKASDRTLTIPAYVTDMLREMKRLQIEQQLKAGKCWKANPENPAEKYCEAHNTCSRPCTGFCSKNCRLFKETNRVFTNELGHPVHPDTPRKSLQKIGAKAGLPSITLHGLRHTAASLFIKDGNAITDVAAFLGHSSPRITMSTYAHAIKETEQARSMSNSIGSILRIAE